MHTISRAERVQALAFLVIGLLLIGGVCGLLIGIPLLKNTRQYFVRFSEPIQGIERGTDVKYKGVKKGRVKRLQIDFDIIQIELEVDADLRITESTLARISSDGILPPYFVELQGSLRDSPELPEGAVIRTDPSAMTTFVEKGMQTLEHLDGVARNIERWTGPENEKKLMALLDDAAATARNASETMIAIRPEAERFVKSYADAAEELQKGIAENREALRLLLEESRKTAAEINRFLESGRLDQVATEASKTLESVRADFNRASASFSRALDEARIDDRLSQITASLERTERNIGKLAGTLETEVMTVTRGELGPALSSFHEAMNALEDLMRTLRNDPSLIIFSKPRGEIQIPRPGYR